MFLTIWDPFGTIGIRFIQVSYVPSLRLFLVILFSLQVQVLTYFSHYTVTFCFTITRSFAALLAADLDWIIGPEYSPGRYILGCSQRLASCLRHSAWTDILFRTFFVLFFYDIVLFLDYIVFFSYFVALFTYFLLTFLYFFSTFPVLCCTFSSLFSALFPFFSHILCKNKNIFLNNQKLKKIVAGTCNS